MIAYTDPEGGGDYDATTQCAVPDDSGFIAIDCRSLVRGKPGELRLLACHVNGKVSQERFGYRVAADGAVDLTDSLLRLELRPFVSAIRDRNEERARSMADGMMGMAKRVADRILRGRFGTPRTETPAMIAAGLSSLSLTDAAASEASVGWMSPRYDTLPGDDVLLAAGNQMFASGIYAHAPAMHRYELGKKWRRFQGQVGLAAGHRGSVVFVVLLDGTELWRSEMIQQGRLVAFDVDVAGGNELQLKVENGGDGNGADWGVWFDPRLTR